jgi:hypothetical protein
MIPATDEEKANVTAYYLSQSPDTEVKFLQKVYSEAIMGHRHDVWDVHASFRFERPITRLAIDVQTLNMLTRAALRAASGGAVFSVDEEDSFGRTRRSGVHVMRRGKRSRTVRRIAW